MNDLPAKLRQLAIDLEKETRGLSKARTNDLLDIASAIEVMERNMIYLASCSAATADELCERKSTPTYQINRQYDIMDATARAIGGFPVWKYAPAKAETLARIEGVKSFLAKRVKKIEQ